MILVLGFCFVPLTEIVRQWQKLREVTFVVRVTSAGTVKFGGEEIPLSSIKPHFEQLVQTASSYGDTPVLVVESYANTSPNHVQNTITVARDAGFAKVSTLELTWPDSLGKP